MIIKGELMKTAFNKLMRNEKGQALPIVLVLLLLGGLITAPLLGYMGTGLIAGRVHEDRMEELYAADAGVEDALWRIINDDASLPTNIGDNWIYSLADINGKGVGVDIVMEETEEGFLKDLLEVNYSGVHGDWQVVDDVIGAGTYEITITYNGTANKEFITGVGAWLEGDYDYVAGSASNMTDDFPIYNFEERDSYKGGTAFIWEWTGPNKVEFGSQSGVYTRTLTFEFAPSIIPGVYISWAVANQASIGVVNSNVTFRTYKITATATDNTTGKQTEIIAYASEQEIGAVYGFSLVTWEIDLQ